MLKEKKMHGFILMNLLSVSVFCQSNSAMSQKPLPPKIAGANEIIYCYQTVSGATIYLINEDGTGNRRIADVNYGVNHPDWSPDATKIAFTSQINQSTYSIRVMNADGSNIVRLTNATGVVDVEPNWSPDGSKIAFGRMYPLQNGRRELWMMNSDGSNQRWLGILLADAAEWSPDGTKLIYAADSSGKQDLFTCNIDGSNVRQLTSLKEGLLQACWMPDGQTILFNSGTGIFTMRNDGTNIKQVMATDAGVWKAMPSPDGSMVAFCSCPQGLANHWEIYLMSADGTNPRRLTNSPGTNTSVDPDWRPSKPTTGFREEEASLPVGMILHQNYPNPFNPATIIRYELSRTSSVKLEVYDLLGGRVRALVDEVVTAGSHLASWDGTDGSGRRAAGGMYFYCLTAGGIYQARKALLLK
jgi:dipeptidyl aminopeptidase/acylaminoacyl peptidase